MGFGCFILLYEFQAVVDIFLAAGGRV